ncbi:MAG: bifunctional 3,4-dihydroxy-2-butanone-4-phosphate synthase/GTP cyclohydrolase II [Bacteroidales bacterium]|nr:bifunctional 3,4-dihydroxy-2-butanone-4-phosphate synthase/GTP cyclohydrolase II [Bacteroidales bacterium]MCF8404207.1 bifunctional 3,4-dihydroxy-2-butanone-4-phosphate synthase/GTP cyclohydrolase II [Bacteroidales bacterium]
MSDFNKISEALEDIRQGKMVVVVDDQRRENEGDLIMAAEAVSPEAINFMAKFGGGLICMPVIKERLNELNIGMMVAENTDTHKTAFTVSVDAKETSTGISAQERALTIKKIIDPTSLPTDFNKPGHVFPLEYKKGGVLVRAGHTEAAVDLAKLAGFYPAGVICEIMNEDGSMARVPQLKEYVKRHNLKLITIADLIDYRRRHEKLVERVSEVVLPTKYGTFKAVGYRDKINNEEHIALIMGEITREEPVLARVHSECLTGDVFGSQRCDCGDQLEEAMRRIAKEGKGVLLYMRQEGRGIGLINKLKAYHLQDNGMDTVEANEALGFPADLRDYGIGAEILADIGAFKLRLMTNNPKKISGIYGFGLKVVERIPIEINHNHNNQFYLSTKKKKLGHMLNVEK